MKTEIFIQKTALGYVAGYSYYNGCRIVNTYVQSRYNGRNKYTLELAHARAYTKQGAHAAAYTVSNELKKGYITQ